MVITNGALSAMPVNCLRNHAVRVAVRGVGGSAHLQPKLVIRCRGQQYCNSGQNLVVSLSTDPQGGSRYRILHRSTLPVPSRYICPSMLAGALRYV